MAEGGSGSTPAPNTVLANYDGSPNAPGVEVISCAQVTTNVQLYQNISESGSKPWTAGVGCANWQDQQWAAMYRNVPFAVDSDTRTGGRRVQVHEFPMREDWINEDLGRLRQQIDVNAFVFGDKSDEWAEMLFAACTASGTSSELYLPMRVPLRAVCISVESAFNAEQLGRINFRMQFSIDPNTNFLNVPSIERPASSTMIQNEVIEATNQVVAAAGDEFDSQFASVR